MYGFWFTVYGLDFARSAKPPVVSLWQIDVRETLTTTCAEPGTHQTFGLSLGLSSLASLVPRGFNDACAQRARAHVMGGTTPTIVPLEKRAKLSESVLCTMSAPTI